MDEHEYKQTAMRSATEGKGENYGEGKDSDLSS